MPRLTLTFPNSPPCDVTEPVEWISDGRIRPCLFRLPVQHKDLRALQAARIRVPNFDGSGDYNR
jgi:hypothetical protein